MVRSMSEPSSASEAKRRAMIWRRVRLLAVSNCGVESRVT